jgi:hypothetical protein
MTALSLNKLNKRIDAAESVQSQYKTLFESAYELALPQRNLWTTYSQGSNKMEKVYSSAGIAALNGFVNRMQSSLTPPFTTWAELKAGPQIDKSVKVDVDRILADETETIFSNLNSSNFPVAVGEMYYDLAVGTGAMLILEGDDETPLDFTSVPTSELALDEGKNGKINGIFRKHSVVGRGVFETWKDVKPTKELLDQIKDSPEKEITFKEVTYLDEKEGIWRYEIIFNKESRIVERVYEVNPWVIVRWSKIAGEVFGRGPLLQALPDLKELNKAKELNLRSTQLNIFGAYTVADDGVTNVNTIKIQPNAMIPVARNAGPNGPSIAALPKTGDFNAQNFMFDDLKMQINKLLLNDSLPPDAGPVRSATEIVERMKQLQVDTGAAFGRLIFEFVQPLLQRVIHILEKKGLIKSVQGGIKIDNKHVTTQILSPIAKTEAVEEVNGIVQADQILKSIDPTGQLTQMTLNTEDLGTLIAEKLGVPPSAIRSIEEKDALKQQFAEAAMADQEQQAAVA